MQYYRIGAKRPEIYSQEFLHEIYELNTIVRDSGVELEGNTFYNQGFDFSNGVEIKPSRRSMNKRINFFMFVQHKKHFLEIGFNAGHSTLLVLRSNPDIKVSAIDICLNKYTKACAEYIKGKFPDRFEFFSGDSRVALPLNASKFKTVDLVHIDGGHSFEVAEADFENVMKLKRDKIGVRHLIVDDIARTKIELLLAKHINLGDIVSENYGNRMRAAPHVCVRVNENQGSLPAQYKNAS